VSVWTGKSVDLTNLHVFGCKVYVHLPAHKRDKLSARSTVGVYLGPHRDGSSHRVFLGKERMVRVTRNVVFADNDMITTGEVSDSLLISEPPDDSVPRTVMTIGHVTVATPTIAPGEITGCPAPEFLTPAGSDSVSVGQRTSHVATSDHVAIPHTSGAVCESDQGVGASVGGQDISSVIASGAALSIGVPPSTPLLGKERGESTAAATTTATTATTIVDTDTTLCEVTPTVTNTERPKGHQHQHELPYKFVAPTEKRKPKANTLLQNDFALVMQHVTPIITPNTYLDAIQSPQADKWTVAMHEEYSALMNNNTWELRPLPPGRKAIATRWIFKLKYTADGEVDRYKARWVAKGFSQQYGINYNETFAPVMRMENLRLLLAIATTLDLEIKQVDVNSAFLQADLDEEIYITQP